MTAVLGWRSRHSLPTHRRLLVAELIVIMLLTLPFPGGARAVLVRWISTSSLLQMLAKPLMYFSVLVVLCFLFTTREMLTLQGEYHDATAGDLAQKCAPHPLASRTARRLPAVEPDDRRRPRTGCSTRPGCSGRSATST